MEGQVREILVCSRSQKKTKTTSGFVWENCFGWTGCVAVLGSDSIGICWADMGVLRKHWEISVFQWKASDKDGLFRENAKGGCLFSAIFRLDTFLMQESVWGFPKGSGL